MVSNDRVLLFNDWRYAWGIKNAMSRVVHRVSKAFYAMGSCIITNVVCERSLYNVATCSTYKIPNYPHALSHTVCGDHKWTELLETLFCIKKGVWLLPIRYDFIVIRLNGSPHQEVCEYYINTPPPPMSNFNGHLLFQADRLSCSYLNPPGGTNFTLPVLILSLSGRRSNHSYGRFIH